MLVKREAAPLASASFNNAVSKSIYHLVPFIVVYSLPVGRDTDVLLFLYEIYIFLSWTLNQSYEYVFTAHLTDESAKSSFRTLVFSTLKKTFLVSIGLYLFYLGTVFIGLPLISGFTPSENFQILRGMLFLGLGFPFGASAAILVAVLTIKRRFFPITLSAIAGLATYAVVFLVFQKTPGSEAFVLALIAGETTKFGLLLFYALRIIKKEEPAKNSDTEVEHDRLVWEDVLFYFLSAMIGGFIPIILAAFATHLGEGSLTMLSYSLRLFYVIAGFFNGLLSLMLVIWVEARQKDLSNAIAKINRTLIVMLLLSLVVLLLVVSFKGLLLSLLSSNQEFIAVFNKCLNIIFLSFPFYILYLVFIRVFIMLKKVPLITILSLIKLILAAVILVGGYFLDRTSSYLPFLAFTTGEILIAIGAYTKYLNIKDTIIPCEKTLN